MTSIIFVSTEIYCISNEIEDSNIIFLYANTKIILVYEFYMIKLNGYVYFFSKLTRSVQLFLWMNVMNIHNRFVVLNYNEITNLKKKVHTNNLDWDSWVFLWKKKQYFALNLFFSHKGNCTMICTWYIMARVKIQNNRVNKLLTLSPVCISTMRALYLQGLHRLRNYFHNRSIQLLLHYSVAFYVQDIYGTSSAALVGANRICQINGIKFNIRIDFILCYNFFHTWMISAKHVVSLQM